MANGDLKTKLVTEADTKSDDDIIKLGQAVGQLGDNADAASPDLKEVGAGLDRLAAEAAKAVLRRRAGGPAQAGALNAGAG